MLDRHGSRSIIVLIALIFALTPAFSETSVKASSPGKAANASEPEHKPAKSKDQLKVPGTNKLTLLIQSHMAALSQAISTENYSVLHALGAPNFQKNNSVQELAKSFSKFKAEGVDFSPVILFVPVLVQQPTLDDNGLLRLKGYYKTDPQNVDFDMLFQSVNGSWRLYGISAQARPAAQGANSALQVQPDFANLPQ